MYQGCLEEYFCEFDAIKYRKEAVLNECSTSWLRKVKDKPLWLIEFFVWINTDLIVINSFWCLSDRKLLQEIELLSEEKKKLF